ncbi:hypothetical protein [Candidatus Tisiphia endosymbiont of Nemotelus uliginosus]|uniref:preprotein translocase subunit SecA n=1 Tax=Candidatus Tisiphia endosymbiont of Nemotelus uliginosus TaxID=3077926 RepID=UPI0035C8A87D
MKATTDTREVPQAQQPTITPLRSVTSQPKQLQQESEILTDSTSEILSKIAALDEKIEVIEKDVIAATAIISEQDNTKEQKISLGEENNFNEKIDEILKDWTAKIQNRYESVGELEAEDVQGLILEVIKTQAKNNNQVSLIIQAVNEELQGKINKIESARYKKDILTKALKKDNQDIDLSTVRTEEGKIEEIINSLLPSSSDEDKIKLLTDYKTIEFLTLQSLIYNIEEKILDSSVSKSIEEISKELQGYYSQNTNSENNIESQEQYYQLEEQYNQLCDEKIATIFKELNILENRFGASSSLNYLIMSMVVGLERFSSNYYHRHTFYDQILHQLEAQSYSIPKVGVDKAGDISAISTELEKLKQQIISKQWKHFVQKQGISLDKEKENVLDQKEKIILGIVEAYCTSEDDNLNLEELEYHIDNMTEVGKLSSQSIYETINNLSNKADLSVAENKRDKINFLQAFILNSADHIELKKITELFEDRLNYQEKQYKEVLEIKNSIAKEFGRYCGILDKSNKENYTKIIKLYLDKLDRLVAEGHAEDISYSKRKEEFNTLKLGITGIIEDSTLKDGEKAEYIEHKISETLNALVFATSSNLPINILNHLEKIIDGSLETKSDYRRETQTGQTIKLEDLFDNSGRIKEQEGKEVFFRNKTVIVNIDREEYYRLSEDINSLKEKQATYEKSIEDYRNELSIQYKKYKLSQLKAAIDTYNSNKNIKNLVNITKDLIYYLLLREEHLESDKAFEDIINKFLSDYYNIIKYLMINDKYDQEVISELRIAIDLFNADVIQERKINNKDNEDIEREKLNTALVSKLKSLRNTLIYKTYKESGFRLFSEEEDQVKKQLALNNFLREKLNELLQDSIPEIIWLRSVVVPTKDSEEFFKCLNDSVNKHLPQELAETNKVSIVSIQTVINQKKNKIILNGLIDGELNVEAFIEKINKKELSWEKILSNTEIKEQHKFKKLSLIIQEHDPKFTKEHLESLIRELSNKETNTDLESFATNILRIYKNKVLEDKKNTLEQANPKEEVLTKKLIILLEKSIINAFNVWQIVQSAQRKKSHKDFIDHLEQLVTCVNTNLNRSPFLLISSHRVDDTSQQEVKIKEIKESLEQKEVNFINDLLDIEVNSTLKDIFAKFGTEEKDEDKIIHLKLLLQLPDSFCSNKKVDYKNFINKLVKNYHKDRLDQFSLPIQEQEVDNTKIKEIIQDKNNSQILLLEIQYYIREHICKYYDLFLDKILNVTADTEDIEQRKTDIQAALKRLYNNISVTGFIKYTSKWLETENNEEKTNFIIKTVQKEQGEITGVDLSHILQFLYSEEKEHVKALLSFGITGQKEEIDNLAQQEVDKTLDEEIKKLLEQCSKQPTTNPIINSIQKIFDADNGSPIIMWAEELIALRLNVVIDLILSKTSDQDHGATQIADILNAFRFFHEEKGNVNEALNTLDLICNNIAKFSTLEEIKQSIYSLVQVDDLTTVNHVIKSSNKQNITVNLLFSQVDAGDNKKLRNAIDKLKFILSTRAFAEINDFCKIFILQARGQQNLDNLPMIIELVIKSKAYLRRDFFRDLEDKDLSLWSSFLEKAIILNELNTTTFNQCRNKEKGKTVDLLYQLKEEKGKDLLAALFAKIKNLDAKEQDSNNYNIKKLNLILNKIIYRSYKCEAIAQLSQHLNEWEEKLFSNNEPEGGEALPIKQLLGLMKEGDKINSDGINAAIKLCLENTREGEDETLIEKLLAEARNLNKKSKIHEQPKNINEWQEQEIKEWAQNFKNSPKHIEMFSWSSTESTETISEIISVIIQAVKIYDHHPKGPRDTQLMSLLLFLDDNNKKGRLGNVYTGEGKTLITVMLATCLGLIGKRVDIVTSSKVLAIRDSQVREPGTKEGYQGFFEMFGLKASNNCDEICEKADTGEQERKNRYESCSIIYGETGYFQRDILLSQFFKKDIRGGSGLGDVLILDEVDSMMIDNAAKTLYISHNITDMRHLRDVFIHIWAAVNSREERYYSEENVQKIIKYINKIICNVENNNSSPQEDDFKVLIPSTLYDFVQMNLKTWIESAYDAKYIEEDNAYIIGDVESQKQNEVIIMDKDTGVEQTSIKWSNGLHQFIQLKHSGKLSDESLKAVYISNAGYFQSYQNLYGMTGTVGDIEERKLLSDVYGIDFFEIPRFKTYRFEYDFESESIVGTSEEWLQNILENIDENMGQQLTYTQEYSELMKKKLKQEQESLEKLIQDYNIRNEAKKVLDLQQVQCEDKIKIYEAMERTSNEVIKICEKPILDKFKTNIKRISDEISTLKESGTDNELTTILEQFLTFLPKSSDSVPEYDIEQFGADFKTKVRELNIVTLHNQAKEKLEEANIAVSKIREEIDYIDAARTKGQKDVEFYQKESKAKHGSKKDDSRRAILIICDNISDLKCIEEKVRKKFNNPNEYKPDEYKIYKYDRAYKKFDVSCLEAGDIVIATNIAGRGADLEVSKQVEENGGLHVILSYMPKNFRIEKQAFGRTARAGNKGTATYIVFDPRKQGEDIDISQLKKERNEEETKRLAVVQKEQLPKIKLEDELFGEFNKLQQTVESKLQSEYKFKQQKTSKDPLKLQIDSLKNKWAIWLNKMGDKFDKIHETGNGEVLKEYEVFASEINNKLDNEYGLIEEPGELNKLGRVYLDNEQYSEALDCFNYIIEQHSSFASIAYYYKAFCIIRKEGSGFDAKVKAKVALKKSLRMLEEDRSKILSRNQILKTINEVARTQGKGLESNCFAKQNEGEAQILSVHINAINSAVGSEISSDSFNAPGIAGDQSQKVFDELLNDQYDIIKDFRISKKCVIASKVVIKDREKQECALQTLKLSADVKRNAISFIQTHGDYVTYRNVDSLAPYESYKSILKTLLDAKVVSERQILKKLNINNEVVTVANSELIAFPDVFHYCKEQVLDDLVHSLINSQKKSWGYKEREKKPSSFETVIYTKQKFIKDTSTLIKVEEVIKIAGDIEQKLLGQLDHQVFCDKGDQIKNILTSKLLIINHTFLEQRFGEIKNEAIFFGQKAEIKEFCLGHRKIKLSNGQIVELDPDNQLFVKEEIIGALKTIIKLSENSSSIDKTNFSALLAQLGFDVGNNIIVKHQLVQVIKRNTSLQEKEINNILTHLEVYTKLNIDHKFLEQRFGEIKNEAIFFGQKAEIKEFCLGHRKIKLSNGQIIELLDNQSFAKEEIVGALKTIIKLSEDSSIDKTNFDALLIQLGFDTEVKFEAINSYNQYSLKDGTYIDKIKEYLETINLKNSNDDEDTIHKIDQLDFNIDSRLAKKSSKITEILKSNLHIDKPLKKEDFTLEEEGFDILRAILTDANIITTSIFNLLMEQEKQEDINPELETILMRMYQANGVITDQNIVLKDATKGSQELFNRMRELHIIKPPKVNFPLGKAKYVPQFLGRNAWKDSSDPIKKIDYIKSKIEKVVLKVFQLERQDDSWHKANEYFTGGIGTESKNKELDEKIETITNIIKYVAGTIKTLPEIKIESKDLRTMFSEGEVPPELMDYIHICFDAVLEYKEDKGLDWDCFLCAMVGLAQIVAGVALEIISGGSAHFIAQTLIAEGIGDIVFAIQASIEGNFSWKSYGQHKVQSLMISLVTVGVGSFLSKGAQAGKLAVGLATKTAITKAIMKTVIVEACTAIGTAAVTVGTEEISKLLIEEIANIHFVQYFEKWTKEDSAYHHKTVSIENKLNALYNKFGTTVAKQSIETCIESSLNQMISGALGNKIFAQVSRVVGSITKGFSTAAKNLGRGHSKAKLLGAIASIVDKTVRVAEFSKNFAQLCNIYNDFYDHLGVELARIEESLAEQQKNGTLKIDEMQIAQDKVHCSFSGEASKDLRKTQEKLHIAFKAKIKNGFLQPAVSSLLHMAMKPIQQMITAPFANAMEQLQDHIDSRSEMFQIAIMNQRADSIVPITTRQKKALELRGEIIKIEDIKNPSVLKAEVANFVGETVETLQKEHGSNVNVMIKDGKIYAVLPTFKQFCDNIQSGNLKVAGTLHIKMAATQAGRNIEVVSEDIDGSKTLIQHEKGPGTVVPIGGFKAGQESYKIAIIEGEEGELAHYAPVIKDPDGNWKVINIAQTAETKDACFGQTMTFLKEYEKNSDLEEAKRYAEDSNKVSEYYSSLGKCVKYNKAIKDKYLQGTTVKSDRIIGGRISRRLEDEHYPSHKNMIVAQRELKTPLANFRNELSKAQEKAENFDINKTATNKLKSMGHIIPAFGSDPDKKEMMMGVLSVEFTNGTTFKMITVSGDNKFYTHQKVMISNNDYTQGTFEPQNFAYQDQKKDFKFIDPGKPLGKIYDVYNREETKQEYNKSCAAQKLFYALSIHMKQNPELKIKGTIDMAESWYRKASTIKSEQIVMQASCQHCEKVLPVATGKDLAGNGLGNYKNRKTRDTTSNDPRFNYRKSNSGLQGVGLRQAASIGWINAYFGEYTLNAIEHILALRINNAGLEEIIIAKGYVFQENYNNLQRMISDLTDTKSRIILAPLNLYNKHAAGIMGIKDQDNELQLYYIDPSNETIPDKLKQIFVDHDLQIVQLPARQQEYANCGPEVIENFMLYLTGERLSQEESIAYHSKLVEQKLVSKDNTLVEVMDSDINNQELPKDLYDNPEQEEVRVESKDVTIEALASTSYPMKYLAPISLTTEDTKLFKQDKDLNTNRSNNPSKNDVTREQKAFFAYSQGNILSNEAWEAESDELNDRSVEAEQKFAASLKLYEEAVKLSPTNIVYKHALDITSLKIEGNNLFSEGIVLASIAYGLQEEANALAVDQEAYEEILGKYQQALGAYKAAQDSFHVGWNLSKDVRFKSCIEIVQDAIELIQEHIEEIQGEMDSASIPKNDIVGTENYLTIGPIELFKQEKQDYILNDYLIGNSQELFYM